MAWLGIYQNAEVNIFFLSIAFFLSNFSVYLFSSVSKTATGASDETLAESLKKIVKKQNMNLKYIKVFNYFWIISIVILIIGIFKNYSTENSVFDINIHDTYYVITNFDLTILLSFLYFLNGFGYWFVEKKLNRNLIKPLTSIHSIILIGSFITYWLVFLYGKMNSNKSFPLFDDNEIINETLVIIFFLIVGIGIPIYIINLIIGIFSKRKAFR